MVRSCIMPYVYISDLPPQIRQTLSVPLQQVWLDTFNQIVSLTGNEVNAYQEAWLKVFQTAFPGEVQAIPQMSPVPQGATAVSSPASLPVAQTNENVAGYWIDVSKITLNDNGVTWLQALPLGTYHHPRYGKIDVTPEKVAQFAANVKTKVRGQDLDIDYDHKEKTTEAAGWVQDAAAKPDGLWLAVEWTVDALSKIKNKAYRYFSPEFADSWTHPKTNTTHRNVLFGGALTNRPFLKDILPINLSEVIRSNEGGTLVDRATMEAVAKRLGVTFDANTSDEDLASAITTAANQSNDDAGTQQQTGTTDTQATPPATGGTDTSAGPSSTTTPTGTQAANQPAPDGTSQLSDTQLRALSERDPVVRALTERVNILETANRLSEVNIRLSEIERGNSSRTFSPVILGELRDLAVALPREYGDKVIGLAEKILKDGIVQLGEVGGRSGQSGSNVNATKQLNDLVEAAMKANDKLTYSDAVEQVAADHPQLFNEHRDESYVFAKEGR